MKILFFLKCTFVKVRKTNTFDLKLNIFWFLVIKGSKRNLGFLL